VKRREFIALLGGAAVTWPLPLGAQQGERIRRIGVLNTLPADDPHGQERFGAFLQGVQQAGWTIGGNVRIDQRWWNGEDADVVRKYAAELVALAPDVIVATGGVAVRPLLQATRSVPIVFASTPDPVGAGWRGRAATPQVLPRSNTPSA
jgi:putative ABC transport system substrate-binding protein